jgi:HEAT repeat protein
VSVDDVAGIVAATGDESREVRIAAAAGLATLRGGAQGSRAVSALIADPDPLVRAAALAALAELGCSQDDFTAVENALQAPAWQVREGAARALSGAVAELAVPRLSDALADTHLDVRKAAVLSLTRWAGEPAARDALGIALKDSDADVRAYARRALEQAEKTPNSRASQAESPQGFGVQQGLLRLRADGGVQGVTSQPALQLEPGSPQHPS